MVYGVKNFGRILCSICAKVETSTCLDVIDDDTIEDSAAYPLGGVGAGNGNFYDGECYLIRYHLVYLPLVIR